VAAVGITMRGIAGCPIATTTVPATATTTLASALFLSHSSKESRIASVKPVIVPNLFFRSKMSSVMLPESPY